MTNSSQKILIGIIGAPHGIKGHFKIRSLAENITDLVKYPLMEENGSPFPKIQMIRWQTGGNIIVSSKDIHDRNQAEALKGTKLYITRENLPEPKKDTFYYHDLIGLKVNDDKGEFIGTVHQILNYGAGDLLEIKTETDTVLLPFQEFMVPDVNVGEGKIIISKEFLDSFLSLNQPENKE